MEMFPAMSDAEVEAQLAATRRSVEDMKSPRSDSTDCAHSFSLSFANRSSPAVLRHRRLD